MYKISLKGEFEVLVQGRKQIVFLGGGWGGGALCYMVVPGAAVIVVQNSGAFGGRD